MRSIALFLMTLAYPFLVVLLFRTQIVPYPAQVALIGFFAIAASNIVLGLKSRWGKLSVLFWGSLIFIVGAVLPISIMNITAFLRDEVFATQSLMNIPAQSWHSQSILFYSLMLVGYVFDYVRQRLDLAKK